MHHTKKALLLLLAVAVPLSGCGTVTSIVSAIAAEWSDGVVLEGERAVVAAAAERLDPSSRLYGHAMLVECSDGLLAPAICIGEDADVCDGLAERDSIVIQRAYWRNGAVRVAGETYKGLYLEITEARRPIGR